MHQRRRFLKVVAICPLATACADDEPKESGQGGSGGEGGAGGMGGEGVGGEGGGLPPLKPFNAGPVSDIAVGELKGYSPAEIIVGRDTGGIYAMSSVCTHSQCDILIEGSIGPMDVRCGCHGSRFDYNGEVLSDPATETLDHLRVRIEEGEILVSQFSFVDKDERVPVT